MKLNEYDEKRIEFMFKRIDVLHFHERIVVDGHEVTEDALGAALTACEAANNGAPITFFEITTAAAFVLFAAAEADFTLLETGLGGRLDATNVIDRPALTALTSISLDHQDFLGETLTAIAREKAGILKPGVPCLCVHQEADSAKVIRERADALGTPLLLEGDTWAAKPAADGWTFAGLGRELTLPPPGLAGAHQYGNAGLAVAAALMLLGDGIDEDAVRRGVAGPVWPARLQHLSSGALPARLPEGWELWLDGGHNPAAGAVLAAHAGAWRDRPLYLVFGILRNKDAKGFLQPFAGRIDGLVAVAVPGVDATLDETEALAIAREVPLTAVAAASLTDALDRLATRPGPARVLICGSLYLAGATLEENSRPTESTRPSG